MRLRSTAAALAGLAGLVLLAGCGDDGDDDGDSAAGSTTTSVPATTAGPSTSASTSTTSAASPESGEFAAAIERATTLTYHATYTGESQAQDGSTRSTTIVVWRRPPLARRDTTVVTGAGELFVQEYRTADGVVGCLDLSAGADTQVQCQDVEPGEGVDPAAPTFEAVDPGAGPVSAIDAQVEGVDARCFRLAALAVQEVCFDGDGIPVVVDDGNLRLVRTALDAAVTDDVLVPPTTG